MPKRPKPKPVSVKHAEWLGLIEASGPFISLPVLVEEMPQGLDAVESERRRPLRTRYQEWTLDPSTPETHDYWVKAVLHDLLEHEEDCITRVDFLESPPDQLSLTVAEHGETISPTLVIHEPGKIDSESARILVFVVPAKQRVDRKPSGSTWTASVSSRAAELCRSSGVRLGLVTNGEQWVLVDAPKDETVGYATWYSRLWLDEPETLDAFAALLGRHRLFSLAEEQSLEGLLDRSRKNQHEVTDQLGLQVRRAVEMLVRSLDRADQDLGGELLVDLEVSEIYEAAVTVMMRLVFLFSAEERGLLLLGDPLFDEHYAVSTLCEQLRDIADEHGEEILERRRDAWCRLLAAFRAVHSGVHHDRLRIPAYGGGLFDPDRFPFLEGRKKGTTWKDSTGNPLPIDNRTVLHCLQSLQYLQTKIGKHTESRRLSFRALDIEQIGHVYEGLLDHTAVRANGPTLGLCGRAGDEPEVELATLESFSSKGKSKLTEHLAKKLKVKSNKKAVEKLLDSDLDSSRAELIRSICGSDALWQRVKPFAPLIRDDDFGHPIVILEGQLFATAGLDRRNTGTHYTPRSLTEPIVEHTLEPLVYEGPAEGAPRDKWTLRSPKQLLDLKVCDMACGSGAFLVQACRYLGDRLVESWTEAERRAPEPNPGKLTFPTIDYEGLQAKGDRNLVPKDPDERLLTARRIIAQRCLYGVDVNPVAAEMAKLSIWLLTLSKDKPFSFLDHAIRSGDSLLGIHDIRQLQRFSLDQDGDIQTTFSSMPITDLIEQASGTRIQIEQLDSDTIGHVHAQARLLKDAESRTERLSFAADMLISGYVQPAANASEREQQLSHAAVKAGQLSLSGTPAELREYANRGLLAKRPFHWCLEYPEVFDNGGFSALIGNPPFLGGRRISGTHGAEYRDILTNFVAPSGSGNSDLSAFFVRRAATLIRSKGCVGLVLTNSIAQGDTRRTGLLPLLRDAWTIYRAESSVSWPGVAAVTVSMCWMRVGPFMGSIVLDRTTVPRISAFLDDLPRDEDPLALSGQAAISFQGSVLSGKGFILSPDEAASVIEREPAAAEVVRPYLSGEDFTHSPTHSASRMVIDFGDRDLATAERQFPLCMRLVRERVKPDRDRVNRETYRRYWWRFAERVPSLYAAISELDETLVCAQVSSYHAFSFVPTNQVLSMMLVVFATDDPAMLAVMQSSVHEAWVATYSSTLQEGQRYVPRDCFHTFPFPSKDEGPQLAALGQQLRQARSSLMFGEQIGITRLYRSIHDAGDDRQPIRELRSLHQELDRAVVRAYGWHDLGCNHAYCATPRGRRLTIDETERVEILSRLFALNNEYSTDRGAYQRCLSLPSACIDIDASAARPTPEPGSTHATGSTEP